MKLKQYKRIFSEATDSGLLVKGRSPLDNKKIGSVVKRSGFYAEWDSRNEHWFFPELRQYYDSLEKEITKEFDKKNISYYIEGV